MLVCLSSWRTTINDRVVARPPGGDWRCAWTELHKRRGHRWCRHRARRGLPPSRGSQHQFCDSSRRWDVHRQKNEIAIKKTRKIECHYFGKNIGRLVGLLEMQGRGTEPIVMLYLSVSIWSGLFHALTLKDGRQANRIIIGGATFFLSSCGLSCHVHK